MIVSVKTFLTKPQLDCNLTTENENATNIDEIFFQYPQCGVAR